MVGARRSLAVWVIYTLVVGAALLLVPDVLLGVFQIDETAESWVRVVGVVVLVLLILYAFMVREPTRTMFEATVYGRGFAALALVVLAFTAGPWQLALFAAVDAAGATWTYLSLRADPV